MMGLLMGMVLLAQPKNVTTTTNPACKEWVDTRLAGLTQDDKIAQLVVVTVPAKVDGATKKAVRDWAKKYRIGAMMFSGGTVEEQTILLNLAQKNAPLPVLAITGGRRLSALLSDVPCFPEKMPLSCVSDEALLGEMETEMARECRELGLYDCAWETYGDATARLTALRDSVAAGTLTVAELDRRCRLVLTAKYQAGLHRPWQPLQVSGMSHRVNSDEAKALAGKLHQATVVVPNNYFGLLPLTKEGQEVAVLSIGAESADSIFCEALKEHTAFTHFHLATDADENLCEVMGRNLASYTRIIVSLTGEGYSLVGAPVLNFLAKQELKAPLVYVCFTPYLSLFSMEQALARSAATVVAHSADAAIQRHVAALLWGRSAASGRLPMAMGRTFAQGDGLDLMPGRPAATLIPDDWGLKSYVLQRIDAEVQRGLQAGAYPGCRVLVLKEGQPVYDRGFGVHSPLDSTAVRSTDLFDMASLTKPMATLLAVMKLYDEGRLKLEDKLSAHLPLLRNTDKRDITIRELLFHESGLPPHIRFYMEAIDPNSVKGPYSQSWEDEWHKTRVSEHGYYSSAFRFKKGLVAATQSTTHTLPVAEGMWMNKSFKQTALQQIAKCDLGGKRYVYSDLGFILLQQVVESVSKTPLDVYVTREFYEPMGLKRTLFLPLTKYPKSEIMPTAFNDFLRRQDLCGYVHDEAAACLGGVAGHAGLFSTVEETAKIFGMLMNGGEWDGRRYLSEGTCSLFTTQTSAISRRGLGFDKPDGIPLNSPCSLSTPAEVYGHTGFSGTAAWVDPKNHLIYIFLSNHICPNVWDTKLGDMDIRRNIQEIIYQSLKK